MGLRSIIDDHKRGIRFSPRTVSLDDAEAQSMVGMLQNPSRFLPSVFAPGWASESSHPEAGEIRLLSIVEGPDGVSRVIGRQGRSLYAFPK